MTAVLGEKYTWSTYIWYLPHSIKDVTTLQIPSPRAQFQQYKQYGIQLLLLQYCCKMKFKKFPSYFLWWVTLLLLSCHVISYYIIHTFVILYYCCNQTPKQGAENRICICLYSSSSYDTAAPVCIYYIIYTAASSTAIVHTYTIYSSRTLAERDGKTSP